MWAESESEPRCVFECGQRCKSGCTSVWKLISTERIEADSSSLSGDNDWSCSWDNDSCSGENDESLSGDNDKFEWGRCCVDNVVWTMSCGQYHGECCGQCRVGNDVWTMTCGQ